MYQLRTKLIHLIVILTMLGGAVLDFRSEVKADVEQVAQLLNVVQSFDDDGISKTDPEGSSKVTNVFIDDAENPKLFLVSRITAFLGSKTPYRVVSLPNISSFSFFSVANPPVRAPPVLI